jgi:signal transduction histidine kinase
MGRVNQQLHPEDRIVIGKMMAQLQKGEQDRFSVEFRVLWPDNTIHWLFNQGRVVRRGDRRILMGVAVDITRLKETEMELQAALAARDEFLSIASHELRTPITSIQLTADLMHRMLSRTRATDPVDLAALAHWALEELDGQIRNLGATWSLETDPGCLVLGDATQLGRVATNLISNALRYGGQSPIRVAVRSSEREVRLEVSDQGPGIAPENHERIFERFERVHVPGAPLGGLGLGLHICRDIIQKHGGSIEVKSSLGQGATFIVRLPRIAGASRIE